MDFSLESIRRAIHPDFGMGWNLILALVPLAIALAIFRPGSKPGWLFWPGLIAFVLFLPNAAYTLTDVIHLVNRIRRQPYMETWTVALVLIPQYALFMFVGVQSHILSLMRLGDYMKSRGVAVWIPPMELALNFLTALGIYFGRFQRFNSWDVVNEPERLALEAINDLSDERTLEVIIVSFLVLTVLYYAGKFVDRAVLEYWFPRRNRGEHRPLVRTAPGARVPPGSVPPVP